MITNAATKSSQYQESQGLDAIPDRPIESRFEILCRMAPALVGLEAFCRQRGLMDIAGHLDQAIAIIDDELTADK
ncbi:MAG: hypothetical protein AAGB19_21535 [Cyanobacteria bacterium P01_F01_bin.3]